MKNAALNPLQPAVTRLRAQIRTKSPRATPFPPEEWKNEDRSHDVYENKVMTVILFVFKTTLCHQNSVVVRAICSI
jgi:hypothetical protein